MKIGRCKRNPQKDHFDQGVDIECLDDIALGHSLNPNIKDVSPASLRLAAGKETRSAVTPGGIRGLIATTDAGVASGAADHLMQQLEGALGGARVAVIQSEVGVDDADEVELQEVMALRHQLGADNDVEAPLNNTTPAKAR